MNDYYNHRGLVSTRITEAFQSAYRPACYFGRVLLMCGLIASGFTQQACSQESMDQQDDSAAVVLDKIADGKSTLKIEVGGIELELFVYKPAETPVTRMLFVMHGVNRNADEYRDNSCEMGDRFGALIVAPCFDDQRFPSRKYQQGGILNRDRTAADPSEWTYQFIPALANKIREIEAAPDLPLLVIGHSAGGQFVVRMSAFLDIGAQRLVAANPGSLLFPTRDEAFGYGFGNLPEELANDTVLERYLAAPLTIYVGTGDNKPDQYFDRSAAAMRQGEGRYQRGVACFEFAKKLADERGWTFNWRLVKAEDVVHDHQAMFNHAACHDALFGDASTSATSSDD